MEVFKETWEIGFYILRNSDIEIEINVSILKYLLSLAGSVGSPQLARRHPLLHWIVANARSLFNITNSIYLIYGHGVSANAHLFLFRLYSVDPKPLGTLSCFTCLLSTLPPAK